MARLPYYRGSQPHNATLPRILSYAIPIFKRAVKFSKLEPTRQSSILCYTSRSYLNSPVLALSDSEGLKNSTETYNYKYLVFVRIQLRKAWSNSCRIGAVGQGWLPTRLSILGVLGLVTALLIYMSYLTPISNRLQTLFQVYL